MNKTQWISALRSGKYKQARGQLKTSKGYCCLGVLCDLTAGEWKGNQFIYQGWKNTFLVPDNLADELGIAGAGYYFHKDLLYDYLPKKLVNTAVTEAPERIDYANLSTLNDAGATFEQIANLLELNHET